MKSCAYCGRENPDEADFCTGAVDAPRRSEAGPKLLLAVLCGLVAACRPLFGQTWTQTSAPVPNMDWQSMAMSADGERVAAAARTGSYPYSGPIYTSADSGNTWVSNAIVPRAWLGVACSADGKKLLAVADSGPMYASTDSGATWTYPFSLARLSSLGASADGTKLVAVGYNSGYGIYLSTDSGNTWTPASGTSGLRWSAVASSADGNKLVAVCQRSGSPGGSIYTSQDSGNSWLSNNAPNLYWVSVASSADGTVLVAAPGGLNLSVGPLCVSTNSGTSWLTTGSPVLGWTSVASSADGRVLIASAAAGAPGSFNAVFTSTDYGASWISNTVPARTWYAVACSADGSKLMAATLYGGIWTAQSTPSPRLNVAPGKSNGLALSWTIPSGNFILEQSPDLVSWSSAGAVPGLNLSNLQNEATVGPTNSRGFYRLRGL